MRLILTCVGRLKAGPERELVTRYVDRATALGRGLGYCGPDLREIDESRARRPEDRKAEEARNIRATLGVGTPFLLFDETGDTISSADFARWLGEMRGRGAAGFGFVIGGPDGLDPGLRAAADRSCAFGRMTWPHQLVRIMAAEQIYRALTILARHPYHRA
jgi:23S rRNA (pseudouridine1915-N3)-methyltransferase